MVTFLWTPLSRIEIHARSTLHPIHAETNAVAGEASGTVRRGEIVLDAEPTGFVEVPIRALRSGNPLEEAAMRRVVAASRFPVLRYELLAAVASGDALSLRGALEMHGVRREFEAQVAVTLDRGWLTVEGEHTFDVREFGVSPPGLLGMKVHPEVRVVARLVGRE